jgi:hypothetical protein
MMLSVGFTKSCCPTLSDFFGVDESEAPSGAVPATESSALVGSDMAGKVLYLSWVVGCLYMLQ